MAFVILCDRCGKIIKPGNSSYASVSCTMDGIMDTFVICDSCAGELKHWIIGDEMDAVPVVRCKDCIHSYDDLCGLSCTCGPYVDCVVQPEFYCADGKRKDGDGNG